VAFFQLLIQNMSALSAEEELAYSAPDDVLEETFEQKAIREMNEALPTRPMRQTPPATAVFEPAEPEPVDDDTDTDLDVSFDDAFDDTFDDTFDDDAPLKTKPLKKD